jgi:hypothetical protein
MQERDRASLSAEHSPNQGLDSRVEGTLYLRLWWLLHSVQSHRDHGANATVMT